ncbi:MAG: A/G-specific adenine glycosylase [Deinococcus sp.]|nr:A/G-specific adenine glycosylase [Deinococcus sp.]
MNNLQNALFAWYHNNKRALPWRGEKDPYRILLSEVLLQQTRAEQAAPYYQKFLQRFPTLKSLARASLEDVLLVWQGAGYYSRARNLHKLARMVVSHSRAPLPAKYAELIELPGIGPYTATAVASIGFGEPVAVVDGNVRRVIARLFAKKDLSASQYQKKADGLLSKDSPGDWNQALMELGATVCVPKNPKCTVCPLARWCKRKKLPEKYPKAKTKVQKPVKAVALVLIGKSGVFLEARNGTVLGGLWGVPLQEDTKEIGELLRRYHLKQADYLGPITHNFTHKKLTVHVYRAGWKGPGIKPEDKPLSVLDRKILRKAHAL